MEPLEIDSPIAAFNGGLMVDRAMQVLEQHVIPEHLVEPVADLMGSFGLDVWVYRGADWYVRDPKGPHVDREAWTVKFEPKVMDGLRRAHQGRREAGRRQRRPRRHRRGHEGRRREVRRPRHGGGLPALLPRRHPPARQQGRGGPVPGSPLRARARGDRDHRRPAQRHLDVRAFGPQHRHGQRRPRSETGRPRGHPRATRRRGSPTPWSTSCCRPPAPPRRPGGSRSGRTA